MDEKIRIIICSSENGCQEDVTFTYDFESPSSDFIRPGLTLDVDEIKELDLPSGFPVEHTLTKS